MSRTDDAVTDAIERWERSKLVDAETAQALREELTAHAVERTGRVSQYVLAITGAVVLVIAGGVFLEWAWPNLAEPGRVAVLMIGGLAVLIAGAAIEGSFRWRPASYLMQTGGIALLLGAYIYSEQSWADGTPGGLLFGFFALATPIVLAPLAMKRNVVMPAVHFVAGLGFLAVFLDRATTLSYATRVWLMDAVLVAAILVLVRLLRGDPDAQRHPWALNAFVAAMAAGFVMISLTAFDVYSMRDLGFLPIDAWLALTVGLTLWGLHRAPPGLRHADFGRLLALECFAWIPLGLATAFETFDGPPELGLIVVGGAGVLAFVHADRHGLQELMGAASLAFIAPVWWWAVDRAGALGGVAALLATAGFLFWASGRRGRNEVPGG